MSPELSSKNKPLPGKSRINCNSLVVVERRRWPLMEQFYGIEYDTEPLFQFLNPEAIS
jgi:hypothetical protein